jgi:hypothetical protein
MSFTQYSVLWILLTERAGCGDDAMPLLTLILAPSCPVPVEGLKTWKANQEECGADGG